MGINYYISARTLVSASAWKVAGAVCWAKLSVASRSLYLSFILENQDSSKKISVSAFWPPRAKDCHSRWDPILLLKLALSSSRKSSCSEARKNIDLKVSRYSQCSKGTLIPSLLPERLNHCIRSSVIAALRLCDSKYYISFPPSSPIPNFFNKIQMHCRVSPEASWDHVSGCVIMMLGLMTGSNRCLEALSLRRISGKLAWFLRQKKISSCVVSWYYVKI